jgi:MFS transporter, YNFM family, putative membrane transport protein
MMQTGPAPRSPFAAWITHLRNARLRAAFGIGFCILFAFIGTFTYVNFVLVRPPLSLGPMQLGFVYFVFLPSIVTTLLAGRAVHRWGTRPTLWGSLALAGLGLPLLLLPNLGAVLLGMVFVGVAATGFVSQAAKADRGAASGIYLACYFAGGLVGTAILGQIFDRMGWPACVAGIALALAAAAALTRHLKSTLSAAWGSSSARMCSRQTVLHRSASPVGIPNSPVHRSYRSIHHAWLD